MPEYSRPEAIRQIVDNDIGHCSISCAGSCNCLSDVFSALLILGVSKDELLALYSNFAEVIDKL